MTIPTPPQPNTGDEALRELIDEAISLYVSRLLIHEDRWTDLKDGLMSIFKAELGAAEKRIAELKGHEAG